MTDDTTQDRKSLDPTGSLSAPAGFAGPLRFQTDRKQEEIARVQAFAKRLRHDPLMQFRLCDRIYQLMLEDMRIQGERSRNYTRGRRI